ncbi:mannose-1-phosphate guanylyltransferase [candidate division LCP-89 bacterium B3_LCP]|uniref:mannose-1-phosphate guanylyltransferase n=1 Tax=candidate division LCP-89 bacterium B3_LCP TaxID=2012998 RepID=A0A532V525_UNCL8|nr:MAG: mannose-1-phosphate guanylyltransferase [candidate division LCP-89 bacterium B3_LCP]
MNHAVIMAGGVGSRFWPRSRKKKPKQVLNIFGSNTLLQETVDRISSIIPPDNVLIVTTHELVGYIKEQLPDFNEKNFVLEPVGRNTAPCIGLAAQRLAEIDPDGIMVVLPADHLITDQERFSACLKQAIQTAEQDDSLVTIGITPTQPETGYGYIQFSPDDKKASGAYGVKTFAEKPNLETARLFIESGDFLWNSGMFIWSVKRILSEIESSVPELHAGLTEIKKIEGSDADAQFNHIYSGMKAISIDYAVMERAQNVAVVKGDFSWSDIGNWGEVYRLSPKDKSGNVNLNNHVLINTSNCLVDSSDRLVATVGIQDLIIINTPDALLVCHRDHAQDVKRIVEYMERRQLDKYL